MNKAKSRQEEAIAVVPKYREICLKKYLTVRIPRGLAIAVEEFIETEEASRMGFDSKTDVVTAAIRKLLMEHGQY